VAEDENVPVSFPNEDAQEKNVFVFFRDEVAEEKTGSVFLPSPVEKEADLSHPDCRGTFILIVAPQVDNPEHYRWSSVLVSVGAAFDPLITPHVTYLHSGADAAQRGALHREWLRQAISDDDLQSIRAHLRQERALGRGDGAENPESPGCRQATWTACKAL
jgi:hypothetical protein